MRSVTPWALDSPVWFLLIKAWSLIGLNHISPLSVWWELQMEHCFHLTCTPRLITATEYYFLRCMLLLKVNITFELLMCFFYVYTEGESYNWALVLCVYGTAQSTACFLQRQSKRTTVPKASRCAGILTAQIHCLLLCFFLFHLFVWGGGGGGGGGSLSQLYTASCVLEAEAR